MIKLVKFLILVLSSSLLFSQNPVLNPGFEDDFNNWVVNGANISIDETNSAEGSKSAYYSGGDGIGSGYQELYQDVSGLTVDKEYKLVFKAAGTVADFYIGPVSNVYTGKYTFIDCNNSGTTYKPFTVFFVASEPTMRIFFDLYEVEENDIYLDDLQVTSASFENIGFEDTPDFSGWEIKKDGNLSMNTVNFYEGSKCAHYPGGDGTNVEQLKQFVGGMEVGRFYKLTFQAAGASCNFIIGPYNAVYSGDNYVVDCNNSGTTYKEQSFFFKATKITMVFLFDLYKDVDAEMYFDDFQLELLPLAQTGDILINEVNSHETENASYTEIFNATDTDISLEGVNFEYYESNSTTPSSTLSLSGVIEANSYQTIARNQTDFQTEYSFAPDYEFTGMLLNGQSDAMILRLENNDIMDQFSSPQPPTAITDDHLYLRNTNGNNGSGLDSDWCDTGVNKKGTPGAENISTWKTDGTEVWGLATNWNSGYAPCECEDVVIPAGSTQPIIAQPGAKARNITVETGATLTIEETGKLTVGSVE